MSFIATKKISSRSLRKLSFIFDRISKKIYTPEPEKRDIQWQKWLKNNGDSTLRVNYNLNQSSIVFDVGGYEGQWSSDIFSKYLCSIYIFEPVKTFFEKIQSRFEKNSKIHVFNIGLSNRNGEIDINLDANSSSVYKEGLITQKIKLVDIVDFTEENRIDSIDLIKINIEGGEYDLLEKLIGSPLIKKIQNIQVQFHNFIPNSDERMKKIQKKLSLTHFLTYQYEFVWENWSLKK